MKKLLLIISLTLLTSQIKAQCFPAISNETLTSAQSTICPGQSATISIGASLPGVKYYLRDNATSTIVTGPINGNGGALSFNSGALSMTKTFHVYGETQPGGNVALDFDGGNDLIYTGVYSSVATSSLTIEAWIYPRAVSYKRIVSNYKATTNPGQFVFDTYAPTNNGRGLRFFVIGAGSVTHSVNISNVLTLNTWNHVAGSFENGIMKLFVNGNAVATSTAPFTSIPANNSNEITIAEDPSIVTAEYFNGMIDEVRIWHAARTATDIATNMSNCLVGNEAGLRNYFRLFENSGTKILDLVTNSVGTMSGMSATGSWTTGNVNCGTGTCNLIMSSLKTISVTACTGITEDISSKQEVILFPNPANSVLNLVTQETIENVKVYSLTGSLMMEEGTGSFSVEHLPAGMYMIEVQTKTGIGRTRFVKE